MIGIRPHFHINRLKTTFILDVCLLKHSNNLWSECGVYGVYISCNIYQAIRLMKLHEVTSLSPHNHSEAADQLSLVRLSHFRESSSNSRRGGRNMNSFPFRAFEDFTSIRDVRRGLTQALLIVLSSPRFSVMVAKRPRGHWTYMTALMHPWSLGTNIPFFCYVILVNVCEFKRDDKNVNSFPDACIWRLLLSEMYLVKHSGFCW